MAAGSVSSQADTPWLATLCTCAARPLAVTFSRPSRSAFEMHFVSCKVVLGQLQPSILEGLLRSAVHSSYIPSASAELGPVAKR
jgi:hypothetical protein